MTMHKPVLLCALPPPWDTYYVPVLRRALPTITCIEAGEVQEPGLIDYAFVLSPPPGYLKQFENLKAIMPVGAGAEHILSDSELPNVPIVRMVQPDMAQRMGEYIVQHALNHLRLHTDLLSQQTNKHWQLLPVPAATETTVGIMGLGTLGLHAAQALSAIGFKVRGWSKRQRKDCLYDIFVGHGQLDDFLSGCNCLVCLLPLTDETRQLIGTRVFDRLPNNATFINASRGAIVNDDELLQAIAKGQLREATLDAFAHEPLPRDHPFWTHPQITVTPHCASAATAPAVAARIQEVIDTIERNEVPAPLVDRKRGY